MGTAGTQAHLGQAGRYNAALTRLASTLLLRDNERASQPIFGRRPLGTRKQCDGKASPGDRFRRQGEVKPATTPRRR